MPSDKAYATVPIAKPVIGSTGIWAFNCPVCKYEPYVILWDEGVHIRAGVALITVNCTLEVLGVL